MGQHFAWRAFFTSIATFANPSAPLPSTRYYSRTAVRCFSRACCGRPPRPVSFFVVKRLESGSLCNYKFVDISGRGPASLLLSSRATSDPFHHPTSSYRLQPQGGTPQLLSRHPHTRRLQHHHHNHHQSRPHSDLRSGLSGYVGTLVLGTAVALLSFYYWTGSAADTAAPQATANSSNPEPRRNSQKGPYVEYYGELIDLSEYSAGMSLEASDGHLGNLTPEQEQKLKELWAALSKISGTAPKDERLSMDGSGSPAPSRQESLAPPESIKKKSRFGSVLGRRSKATDDSVSEMSVVTPNNVEDKYGQTKDFKRALAEMKPEQIREWFWKFQKSDDPDALCLRFLRARKWNVQNALVMMVATVRWRGSDVQLDDDLMIKGEKWFADQADHGTGADHKMGSDFMRQVRMGKSFVHGTDYDGRPMCFIRVKLHKGGEQTPESLEKLTLHTIETARLMLRPPVETACLVFDMTGFGLANMDYTPVKFMVKVFEANYPESLGHIFVYKAPWIFNGIWRIIKGWLDPVVASKVHFLNNERELSEYVAPAQIPKELGGDEDWEYEYIEPIPGENKMMEDHETRDKIWAERWQLVDQYEKATQEWISGKSNEKEVLQRRKDISAQLRDNYWKLDPYIRGKSVYDRIGMITSPGGAIDMYPKQRPAWVTGGAAVNGIYHQGTGPSAASTESVDDVFVDAVEYQ